MQILTLFFVSVYGLMAQMGELSRSVGNWDPPDAIMQFPLDKPVSLPTSIDPVTISGITWTAMNVYHEDRQENPPVAGTQITARFGEDGVLSGSAGCNRYKMFYWIDGANMTIRQPAATRQVCRGEGIMAQEATFLGLLPQVVEYTFDGSIPGVVGRRRGAGCALAGKLARHCR